jgi:hypothetical protein
MTTISAADLTSELVDLTAIPLRQLRTTTTTQLTRAVEQLTAFSIENPDEVQEQNQ